MRIKIVYDHHGLRIWPDIPLAQREVRPGHTEFYDPTGLATPTRYLGDLLDCALGNGVFDQMIASRIPVEHTLEIAAVP